MAKKIDFKESEWTSPNLMDKLRVYWLPNRCFLCGKWKLFGKNPHKVCVERELRMDDYLDREKEKYENK